jgi:membrane protein DedA with SNARE-associated domain
MFEWTQAIASAATQWLEQGNPLVFAALFLIATVIEIGIPVPFVQDTVLLYLGFEPTGKLLLVAPLVMATLMAGRILGGSVVFWVARSVDSKLIRWLGKKSPKLLIKAHDLGVKLGKRTPLAVALARLTPGLLTASSVAASVFRVRYAYFCFGIMISSVIPDAAEVASGVAIRAGFKVAGLTPSPTLFVIVFLCFMALVWLGTFLWKRLLARKQIIKS